MIVRPHLQDADLTVYCGDALDVLRSLPDRSVHMCATSPPFYGLRDYGTGTWEGGNPDCDHAVRREIKTASSTLGGGKKNTGHQQEGYGAECGRCGARRVDRQIGLEETPDQWVQRLVAVFREVRRVLRDDGTLWVEIGDSYNAGTSAKRQSSSDVDVGAWQNGGQHGDERVSVASCKPKDLLGQPWLLAFALRADGWFLRSEIIWARPNPMPESVTDRPTKSHSTVFLLSKSRSYFYDADAIREDIKPSSGVNMRAPESDGYRSLRNGYTERRPQGQREYDRVCGANARSVWTVPTEPTPFAHFATWPRKLVTRMILAGTSERGCCPECGAPWVRQTDETHDAEGRTTNGQKPRTSERRGFDVRMVKTTLTTGWMPSCWPACDFWKRDPHERNPRERLEKTSPCTVLDPFAGSGTTLLVARQLGRHSIGVELSPEYCELIAKRTQQQSLLAGDAT